MIKCCYKNILETSSVSLSQGSAHQDFPLWRLWDRNTARIFRASSAQTIEIKIDQGDTVIAVDRLIIPKGHNLAGMTLSLKHSADDINYTDALPQWVQPDAELIDVSLPLTSRRYWKFAITAPSVAPELTELFLSPTYVWEKAPSRPLKSAVLFNTKKESTSGGEARFLITGPPLRRRLYTVKDALPAQKESIQMLLDEWAGCKPFFLNDEDGEWIFGGPQNNIEIVETGHEQYSFTIDFLEAGY